MLLNAALFTAGLVAMYFGAEALVRGAARLARSLGIGPLIVGLTVVAFGTSAPELIVSALAAGRGQSGVALGNVLGSNICNIGLILGLSAVVSPIRAEMRLIRRETPLMIAVALVFIILALDGDIGRVDGVGLVILLGAYLWLMLRVARTESVAVREEFAEYQELEALDPRGESRLWNLVLIAVGLVGLVAGAHLLVTGALFFARALGISEIVIGLTVVAVGTSLPELATSLVAAIRRESDIALGNVVGSNIFNLLGILGIAAIVHPIGVDPTLWEFEIPVMVGLSVLLLILLWRRLDVTRWEGAVLLALYLAFTVWTVQRGRAAAAPASAAEAVAFR